MLNSDLSTVHALTSTLGTVEGGYIKAGKIVNLSVNFKVTEIIPAGSNIVILSGLPLANVSYVPVHLMDIGGGGIPTSIFVKGDKILIHVDQDISASAWWTISCNYNSAN